MQIHICTLINHISEKLMVFQILLRASLWPDVAVGLVGMRLLDLVLALSMLVSPNQLTSSSRSCTQDNGETGVCCERFTRNKSKLTCPMFHWIAYLPFILGKCAHLFRSSELFAFSGALPPCHRQDQRSRRAWSCRSRGRLFCQNTECDKQVKDFPHFIMEI